jgi:DICT domain-containing protein
LRVCPLWRFRRFRSAVNTFSLFEEALRIAESSDGEDLTEVTFISRRDFDERETFAFETSVPCLEYVSLLIENAVLLRTHRDGRVYAGFEKLSRMEGIVDRYLRIADVSERVYVFGEADWQPPRHPNMRVITLPRDSQLAREWFIIANSPVLKVALVAFDKEASGAAANFEARKFRALKTSNPEIVARLTAMAEELIDLSLAA